MKKISFFWSLAFLLFIWWCALKETPSSLDSESAPVELSQDALVEQADEPFVPMSGDDIQEVPSKEVTVIDLSWMAADTVSKDTTTPIPEKATPSTKEVLVPEAKKLFDAYSGSTSGDLTEDDIDFAEKIIEMVKSILK